MWLQRHSLTSFAFYFLEYCMKFYKIVLKFYCGQNKSKLKNIASLACFISQLVYLWNQIWAQLVKYKGANTHTHTHTYTHTHTRTHTEKTGIYLYKIQVCLSVFLCFYIKNNIYWLFDSYFIEFQYITILAESTRIHGYKEKATNKR